MRSVMVVIALLFCWTACAWASGQPIRLSLGEAVRMAAEKNLDVRAELYTPAQYQADINRNRAIYDPQLNIETHYSDFTNPVSGSYGSASNKGHSFVLDSSLSQLFWTGATATLGFNNSHTKTNQFSSLNNYWQSSLGVTLSQPLLKNMGRDATDLGISISRFSKYASMEHFRNLLLNTVSQARTEYFKLYGLQEVREVKRVSLALARRILDETRARVSAGVLPAMEILNAEYGVTTRERELIAAEKEVNDQVDVLRLLLQISGKGEIVISDTPRRAPYPLDQDQALRQAMGRPDIRELQRSLDISELQSRVFGNNIKPDLNLSLSGSLVGQGHSYGRDIGDLGSFDYPAWSIGLVFKYPLGNNAAENDYRKSRLKNAQTALQIRSLEESAKNEVLSFIRAIDSAFKQIEVADRGRAFAEERLRAFMRKNSVGLATTKDVLEVEHDLADAKNSQIAAAVAHDNAITRFLQATGQLLDQEGVRFVEGDADRLYLNIY
ncbi:TolC family protein [Pelobacter propionicus]|nr:TolC family protein [Pelobacter propionicus]